MLYAPGRRLGDTLTGGLLTVEQAQRIPLQPCSAIGAELIYMSRVMPLKLLQISGSAQFAPDAVHLNGEIAQTQRLEEVPRHFDYLSVKGRVAIAHGFKAKLLMLSVSPFLGSLVSEDGGKVIEPYRLRQVMHAMLQVGATYRGGALGPQRHRLSAAILKGVGLLLYNVRARTDGANKKAGILKNGGIDALIAIELANLRCLLLDISKVALFRRQDVRCAPGCLIQREPPFPS